LPSCRQKQCINAFHIRREPEMCANRPRTIWSGIWGISNRLFPRLRPSAWNENQKDSDSVRNPGSRAVARQEFSAFQSCGFDNVRQTLEGVISPEIWRSAWMTNQLHTSVGGRKVGAIPMQETINSDLHVCSQFDALRNQRQISNSEDLDREWR
jgi:hypothetical protein